MPVLLRQSQTHALALPPIGGKEVDAGVLQRVLDGCDGAHTGIDLFAFQAAQGVDRNDGAVGEVLLGPAQQSPGGPYLAGGNHDRRIAAPHRPQKSEWRYSSLKGCFSPSIVTQTT